MPVKNVDHEHQALLYAETHGICEYVVHAQMMCYRDETFMNDPYFVVYDLDSKKEVVRVEY